MHHVSIVTLALLSLLLGFSTTIKGQSSAFKVEKIGEGSPIILIPGLSCDGQVWDQTVGMLEKDYECHVLTLAGFAGQAPMDLSEGFLPVVEKEIMAYIKEKNMSQPVIIGHSLGGFLAMSLAANHPKQIGKIVIVDSYPFLPAAQNPMATEESMKPIVESMKQQYAQQTEEAYQMQLELTLNSMIATKDSIPVVKEWGTGTDRETEIQAMVELYGTDLRDDIATIESPVLVLAAWVAYKPYGVTKEMILSNLMSQYQTISDVDIQLSDTGYHFLMWDDHEFTLGAIEDFLAGENGMSQR
ncbi:MAG: alpha/beta hydrolase [Bacteroidota bacterium]